MNTLTECQALAISANGNVLVSAGAGTGKTSTIVERCLRLMTEEGCSLENILMVTFTEAAAAEMRARLRRALEMRSAECGVRNDERAGTGVSGSALRIPHSALEEQLALLDTAHISTLHSFCLHLIRDEFHRLEIDPQVSVLDEGQTWPHIHETLDTLLLRCFRDEAPFAAPVRELIRRHGGSDEKVRALVLRLHRYTQSRPDAEAWFVRQLNLLQQPEPNEWRGWLSDEFVRWSDEWLPELKRLAESPNVGRCVEALEAAGSGAPITRIAEATVRILAALEDHWPKPYFKKDYRDPIESFFEETKFFASITQLRDGREPLADDWEWVRYPMIALLGMARAFTAEFTRAKRQQGAVDFADLEQLALRLLVDEQGRHTETARAWQKKFTHVFVDECQDINAAQDAIIRAVSRDAERGNRQLLLFDGAPEATTRKKRAGANRFLVGDVKQSIYRFRLADPTIFRRYEKEWRHNDGGRRIPLADNFRSREGVLNFINSLFGEIMRPSVGGVAYDEDAQLRFGAPEQRAPLSGGASTEPRVELHIIHKPADASADTNGETDEGFLAEANSASPTICSVRKKKRGSWRTSSANCASAGIRSGTAWRIKCAQRSGRTWLCCCDRPASARKRLRRNSIVRACRWRRHAPGFTRRLK
jgi:ATP-dependent helicase/nuclease subunit A